MATTGNRDNDTPVQSQSERAAFFVCEPSQAMRAAGREPAGGEIPVELTSRQPFDDFPQQSGVSRTNRIVWKYKGQRLDGSTETENVCIFPTLILFCL